VGKTSWAGDQLGEGLRKRTGKERNFASEGERGWWENFIRDEKGGKIKAKRREEERGDEALSMLNLDKRGTARGKS